MRQWLMIAGWLLLMLISGCDNDDLNRVCVDDMLDAKVISGNDIQSTLNGEQYQIKAVELTIDDSNCDEEYVLHINGLIPNESVHVPISATSLKDGLYIEGHKSVNCSDFTINGVYTFTPAKGLIPAVPHLVLDVEHNITYDAADKTYIVDLTDNPFNIRYFKAGITNINGVDYDNSEVARIAVDAINRDLASNGKKIKLSFDKTGQLSVETMMRGESQWVKSQSLRYWGSSVDSRFVTMELSKEDKAIFSNLWYDEPIVNEPAYYATLPLSLQIRQNGNLTELSIMHIVQTHVLFGYINYKNKLGVWSQIERECLSSLAKLVSDDRDQNGMSSSIWYIGASVAAI